MNTIERCEWCDGKGRIPSMGSYPICNHCFGKGYTAAAFLDFLDELAAEVSRDRSIMRSAPVTRAEFHARITALCDYIADRIKVTRDDIARLRSLLELPEQPDIRPPRRKQNRAEIADYPADRVRSYFHGCSDDSHD